MNPPDVVKSVALQRREERNSIENYLDTLVDMPLKVGLNSKDMPQDNRFTSVDQGSKLDAVK